MAFLSLVRRWATFALRSFLAARRFSLVRSLEAGVAIASGVFRLDGAGERVESALDGVAAVILVGGGVQCLIWRLGCGERLVIAGAIWW